MIRDLTEIEQFTNRIAKEAGRLITSTRADALKNISYKTPRDFVTSADVAAEKLLIEYIHREYPNDLILAEETASSLPPDQIAANNCWIIDPIDGTMNYAFSQHHTCVSIAYAEHGVVKVGSVYGPFYDELFSASLGNGATLNGNAIKALPAEALGKALICVGRPQSEAYISEFTTQVERLLRNCLDLRRDGAAALDICWIACNRHNAFFETLNPWDIAAASLILREAGGKVGHYQSGIFDQSNIDQSNAHQHQKEKFPEDLNAQCFLATSPDIFDDMQALLSVA
ncbi:MAG: inositol monophosphatase [Bdellovibrionales bacterium]|nr:inositol monophosphatase [Bdellovibrionales bacterium]